MTKYVIAKSKNDDLCFFNKDHDTSGYCIQSIDGKIAKCICLECAKKIETETIKDLLLEWKKFERTQTVKVFPKTSWIEGELLEIDLNSNPIYLVEYGQFSSRTQSRFSPLDLKLYIKYPEENFEKEQSAFFPRFASLVKEGASLFLKDANVEIDESSFVIHCQNVSAYMEVETHNIDNVFVDKITFIISVTVYVPHTMDEPSYEDEVVVETHISIMEAVHAFFRTLLRSQLESFFESKIDYSDCIDLEEVI